VADESKLAAVPKIKPANSLGYYARVLRRNVGRLNKRLKEDGDHSPKAYMALAQLIRTACFVHDCIAASSPESEAPGWRMKGVG